MPMLTSSTRARLRASASGSVLPRICSSSRKMRSNSRWSALSRSTTSRWLSVTPVGCPARAAGTPPPASGARARAPRGGPRRRAGRGAPARAARLAPPAGGRRQAGDLAADDERLHVVGALEGVDRLDVGVVAGDVVLQQDPVATEQVAGVGHDPPCGGAAVPLGQRGPRGGHPPGG